MRERFIKSHLEHVDMFLAPSQFLLERYVDWGIPRDRIRFEDYGRIRENKVVPAVARPGGARNRIGFFGQLNNFKGVNVLLKAMSFLGDRRPDAHLWLHGANLEGADLTAANLRSVMLSGTNLKRAVLYGANLEGANLTRANLEDAYMALVQHHEGGRAEAAAQTFVAVTR